MATVLRLLKNPSLYQSHVTIPVQRFPKAEAQQILQKVCADKFTGLSYDQRQVGLDHALLPSFPPQHQHPHLTRVAGVKSVLLGLTKACSRPMADISSALMNSCSKQLQSHAIFSNAGGSTAWLPR